MELRRNVKAPKRYDDESFDDPDRKPSPPPPRPPRPPPARTRIRSAVQPKIIEFNPDLPPAAFPTLNSWVPTKPEVDDLDSTVDPSLLSLDPNWSPTHTKPKIIHDFILPVYPRHSSQEMDGSDGFMEQGHLPMTHPPNSMLTSEEAFMLEMQTSDEEEPSDTLPQTRKQTRFQLPSQGNDAIGSGSSGSSLMTVMNDYSCPNWEELSAAHQLDLVLTLSDLHGTTEHAVEKLRLNQGQIKAMLDLLSDRKEQESTENAQMDALQQRLNEILSDGNASRVRHMSQETYRALATEYLYENSKGQEFYLSTAAEFAVAARYLESCGHDPSKVLDHWHDEFGAQAVSRFPAAAVRLSKRKCSSSEQDGRPEKAGRLEQVAPSEQEIVYPDTPISLLSSQPSSSAGSAFNPSLASSSTTSARNARRKPTVPRTARQRANRNNRRK